MLHTTLSSWDFPSTLSLSTKKSLSPSLSSLSHPDDAPHTTDPVFELDEDRVTGRGQDGSEASSSGPATPGPATPVLDGLSSPPKDELANQGSSVAIEDGPKSDLGYDPPTTVPIPTRTAHTRSTSRSAQGSPADPDDVPIEIPHSDPPDRVSHGSRLWNKWTKPGSNRNKKLNSALDKTGTLVRVMSAGFSSKSPKT